MNYTKPQLFVLVLLRVVIGWHLLYEGIVKFVQSNWSAALYLEDSQGCFKPMFDCLLDSGQLVRVISILNQYGLILAGLALISGTFVKFATWCSIFMLLCYTLSHPSYVGSEYMMAMEGSYLWVDKNIIEIVALLVIWLLPTSKYIGLDRFLQKHLGRLI